VAPEEGHAVGKPILPTGAEVHLKKRLKTTSHQQKPENYGQKPTSF